MENIVGKRIRMIEMKGEPDFIQPDELGTVIHVGGGVINVDWDNGRKLGVIEDFDTYEIIEED